MSCPYCNCNCQNTTTLAESLLDIADALLSPRDMILDVHIPLDDTALARAALAFALRKRDNVFIFRAIVEEWDQKRLIKEMY